MHAILNDIWQQFRAMSQLELWGAITGLVSMFLMVRNNVWTWSWGLVSVVLTGIVFYQGQLWANAWLQFLYYLPIYCYGWWIWLRGGPKKHNDLPIQRLTSGAILKWIAVTIVLCVVIVAAMLPVGADKKPLWPDPYPWADGITTGMSLVAQYLQARKWMENWPLWLVADSIYTFYLLPKQHYYAFTLLYAITLILAIIGWREWLKIMRTQETTIV